MKKTEIKCFIGIFLSVLTSCSKDSTEYSFEGNWSISDYRWETYWSQKKGSLGELTDSIYRMQKMKMGISWIHPILKPHYDSL